MFDFFGSAHSDLHVNFGKQLVLIPKVRCSALIPLLLGKTYATFCFPTYMEALTRCNGWFAPNAVLAVFRLFQQRFAYFGMFREP